MKKQFLLATLVLAPLSVAHATGPYIGVSVGQSNFDDAFINAEAFGISASQDVELDDTSSTAGAIYAGYAFNDYLGAEVSLGGYDALNGDYYSIGDMMYFAVQPKVTLPLNDRFNLFAKAGLAYFEAEVAVSNAIFGLSGNSTVSDDTVGGMLSAGAEFYMTDQLSVRASWDYMRPELDLYQGAQATVSADVDINTLSVGISYHF